jgi:hypothetical protein
LFADENTRPVDFLKDDFHEAFESAGKKLIFGYNARFPCVWSRTQALSI